MKMFSSMGELILGLLVVLDFQVVRHQAAFVHGASSEYLAMFEREEPTKTRHRRDDNLYVLTQQERMEFLQAHNKFRNEFTTTSDRPQPEGGCIHRMYWNSLLEASAIDWARQCHTDLKHGQTDMVKTSDFLNMKSKWGDWIGQNLYRGSAKPKPFSMIYAFANETYYFTYRDGQSGTCAANKMCGHFTQVVWQDTIFVGCGSVQCGNVWLGACNYLPGGNYAGAAPYKSGPSCSLCASSKYNFTECDSRLCVPKDRCSPVKECDVVDPDNCLCSEVKYNEIVSRLLASFANRPETQKLIILIMVTSFVLLTGRMRPISFRMF